MEKDAFILDKVVKRVGRWIKPNPLNYKEETSPWYTYAIAMILRALPFVVVTAYVLLKTTPCWFKETTGLPCFGCGGTTAAYALFNLDVATALTAHGYFTVVAIPVVLLSGRFIVTGKQPSDVTLIVFALSMLLYGFIRIAMLTI